MPVAGTKNWTSVDKASIVRPLSEQPNQKSNQIKFSVQKNDQELMEYVRQKIVSRGARGINGLKRVFKIMDDDDSKSLDQ